MIGKDSENVFHRTHFVAHFYLYFGFQRNEKIYPGAELYYSALVSPVFHFAGLAVAHDAPGEGSGNLLEENLSKLVFKGR